MDENIIKKMQELQELRQSKDVIFLGDISLIEIDAITDTKVLIKKDIMVSIENGIDDKLILKFYDEDKNLIGLNLNDGLGVQLVSTYYDILKSKENKDALNTLNKVPISKDRSLLNIKKELEEISQHTQTPEERIKSVSAVSLEQKVDEKEDDDKIHLKEDEKEEKKSDKKKNPKKENKIRALEKQSTDLNQKVDDIHTLGQILGISDGVSLVAVYSDDIENGNTNNHTKFSFLIKDKDGNYKECPNIEQIGGTTPETQIAESNYDGSNVQTGKVNSLYRIKSTSNIEYMLTANIGSHGTIELGIGQRDKTQGVNTSNLTTVTTPLKTTSTYHTTSDTRTALNGTRDGIYQSHMRIQEGETHSRANCETDKDEFDGDKHTGHTHEDFEEEIVYQSSYTEQEFYEMALDILEESDIIGDIYNRNDIVAHLEEASKENPDFTKEELSDMVKNDMEESAEQEHER